MAKLCYVEKKNVIFLSNAPIPLVNMCTGYKWGWGITPKTPCSGCNNATMQQSFWLTFKIAIQPKRFYLEHWKCSLIFRLKIIERLVWNDTSVVFIVLHIIIAFIVLT